jgi:hypothetical protein
MSSDDITTRIEKLESTLLGIETEQMHAKTNFSEIAVCLTELTTENLALWEISPSDETVAFLAVP